MVAFGICSLLLAFISRDREYRQLQSGVIRFRSNFGKRLVSINAQKRELFRLLPLADISNSPNCDREAGGLRLGVPLTRLLFRHWTFRSNETRVEYLNGRSQTLKQSIIEICRGGAQCCDGSANSFVWGSPACCPCQPKLLAHNRA